MRCHLCGVGRTRVVESRHITTDKAYSVRRRRTCPTCKRSFYTSEIVFSGPHNHTLTMEDVANIRTIKGKNPSVTHRIIAMKYGVAPSTITRILNGTRWPAFVGPRKQADD